MPRQPVGRWQWADLPETAQAAVTSRFGAVLDVETAPPGLTPGVAATLTTDSGKVFLKAAPLRSPAIGHYRREQAVNRTLPSEASAPAMVWDGEHAGWLLLVFDHIAGRPVNLTPGSSDVDAVMDLVDRLDTASTSAWSEVPTAIDRVQALRDVVPPDADPGLMSLADRLDPSELVGDRLLHTDIHEGNLLVAADRLHLVDWSLACQGPAWIEAAWLIPRLIVAGYSPDDGEALAHRSPTWTSAPPTAVTALAALRALAARHLATHGPDRQRDSRHQLAHACAAWLHHRLARDRTHASLVTTKPADPKGRRASNPSPG